MTMMREILLSLIICKRVHLVLVFNINAKETILSYRFFSSNVKGHNGRKAPQKTLKL